MSSSASGYDSNKGRRVISIPSRSGHARACRSFANGVGKDIRAVCAAISFPWSDGQTEAQIAKLKLVKRQMYGRGKLGLLSKPAWSDFFPQRHQIGSKPMFRDALRGHLGRARSPSSQPNHQQSFLFGENCSIRRPYCANIAVV
jgi:hypothetical protein